MRKIFLLAKFTVLGFGLLLIGIVFLKAYGTTPSIEEIQFFYRSDAEARFIDLKTAWQNENKKSPPLDVLETLASQAYEAASLSKPFKKWAFQGGPNPEVITSQVHIQNPTSQALLNLSMQVTVRAHVGDLRVDPRLVITDYDYLKKTAHWETLLSYTKTIPVMAPGEDILEPVLRFELIRFLRFHPDQWPESLEVTIQLPNKKNLTKKSVTLHLIPDHFIIPEVGG